MKCLHWAAVPATQAVPAGETTLADLAVGTRWLARVVQVLPRQELLLEIGEVVVRARWDGPAPRTAEIEVEVTRRWPRLQLRLVRPEAPVRRGVAPDSRSSQARRSPNMPPLRMSAEHRGAPAPGAGPTRTSRPATPSPATPPPGPSLDRGPEAATMGRETAERPPAPPTVVPTHDASSTTPPPQVVPLPARDPFVQVQIAVDRRKGDGRAGRERTSVRLHLVLAALGTLESTLTASDGRIDVRFTGADAGAIEFLRRRLPAWHEDLTQRGRPVGRFAAVTDTRERTAQPVTSVTKGCPVDPFLPAWI
ncbi:MAG TPA: flagellar hook-length control protein FliK [bacterium]